MSPSGSLPLEVGTELPEFVAEPISRTTLALFAAASGDHNPIHIDVDVARSAGLDDVFAHGMLSMAYLSRLLLALADQSLLRSYAVRFTAVTPVHARATCKGRVVSAGWTDGEQRATVELTVRLDDGTETLRGTAEIALQAEVTPCT